MYDLELLYNMSCATYSMGAIFSAFFAKSVCLANNRGAVRKRFLPSQKMMRYRK